MVSWLNLLSAAGMIAVGAIAIFLWRRRAGVEYFLFGAVFWMAAIGIKVVMEYTVTAPFRELLPHALAGTLILGLYYGLRTGVLESGITYVSVRATRLKPTFAQAVAIGIGFGAAEAILLGVQYLASLLILTNPFTSPAPDALLAESGLALVPVIERLFTLLCHVFATVLALYAIKAGLIWLALSMAFKTALDGSIIWLDWFVPRSTVDYIVIIEAFVVIMGLASVYGLYWLRKRYDTRVLQA